MSTNQFIYVGFLFLLVLLNFFASALKHSQVEDKIDLIVEVQRVHLPTKCKEFYNDGTGRWAECMGVGPK